MGEPLAANHDGAVEAAPRVVVVDDDPLVLAVTRRLLQRAGYDVFPCDHPRTALREVVQSQPFALVADLHMPDLSGAELLRLVRSVSPNTRRILYTGEAQVSELARALTPMVADAIVAKADGVEFLPAALDGLRVAHQTGIGPVQARSLALGMARALASNSVETLDHCLRVSRWARRLGTAVGIEQRALLDLEVGALLHDVGMICVPEAVLRYAGPLSDQQWDQIKQHPKLGADMLRECDPLLGALPVVLHHHERYDGRGYPGRLAGEQIPLNARLFAVIDAYEALTHSRPHASARSDAEAREEIARHRGTHFDPTVVEAFLSFDADEWRRPSVAPRPLVEG
jgi:response regulator RpfG family c-di-GMP phosphodiesterase